MGEVVNVCVLKTKMSKLEMIKKLEYLIAFQSSCLEKGDWDNFDRIEDSIKNLEKNILKCQVE
jgi:hypothetical protein